MPVPFKQFDLGSVIQTAEAIKGMRRDEQNDKIRNAYMGEQISQMQASRPLAAAKEQRDQQQFDQQNDAENAKRNYLVARAVKGSQDPHGDIRRFAPEFVQEVDQHYGPGAFDQMTGEQLQMAMGKAEQFYGAKAGFDPAAPQKLDALVEYVDDKGNPVYGTREQALGKTPYHEPQRAAVEINNGGKFEGAAEKAYGEQEGKDFSALLESGLTAQEQRQKYKSLLENPAVTGPTQDFRASANSFFADMGVPLSPEKLGQISNFAQYKSVSGDLVAQELRRNTGVQTEGDAKRVREYSANSGSIGEANKAVLRYQMAVSQRQEILAEMAESYRQQNGKIDGWRKNLREYVRQTPLSGYNPQSNRLVFFNEFEDAMREHNPEMSNDQIVQAWREKYAGKN